MKRLTVALLAGMLSCTTPNSTQPATATAQNSFSVVFQGLICHLTKRPGRAVIVKDAGHAATLYVPESVDAEALHESTGQDVKPCEHRPAWRCVKIDGFSMRIARATDHGDLPDTVGAEALFKNIVPHLSAFTDSPYEQLMGKLPPDKIAAGLFIMTSGQLSVDTFDPCGGWYVDEYGNPLPTPGHPMGECLSFPKFVTLGGTLDQPAVLQIFSRFTPNGWQTIRIANSGELFLIVENRPKGGVEDGAHIKLHGPLFKHANIPRVRWWCPMHGQTCIMEGPSTLTAGKDSALALGDGQDERYVVPGCDNTQFP